MTEEEAWALEEEVTKNPPAVDPAKARRPVCMIPVDGFSADWLRVKAAAEHTTPEAIIGALVRKEIAASA
jgi:hypothetical protein